MTHQINLAGRVQRTLILAAAAAVSQSVLAASGTWLNTGATDANWSTSSNWVSGTIPGATTGTASTDVATFNTALGTYGTSSTPVLIDLNRNLKSITFDTANVGAFNIGTTGGNPLLITKSGGISMTSTVLNTETVNAPLSLQTNGSVFTLTNNSASTSAALNIGGAISAAAGVGGTTEIQLLGSNTGSNTVSGVIADGVATVKLTKNGAGTWLLSGADTFTGATVISAGTLSLGGASGALTNSASVTVAAGATFLIDDSSANANRLKDTAGITLNNGSLFSYVGSASTSAESTGAFTLANGIAKISVAPNGSNTAKVTTAAATGGFTRTASSGGIVLINGTGLGLANSGQFVTGTAPTQVGTTAGTSSISAGTYNTKIALFALGESSAVSGGNGTATGTANTFLTYNASTGYRPLNPTEEFANDAITGGNNTYLTAGTTAASGTTAINSLVVNGGNLSIAGGATLTNTSGMLLFAQSGTVGGAGTFTIGGASNQEGIIAINAGVKATISSALSSGTTGLSVYGPGTLTLSGSNTTLAGNLAANAGATVVIGSNTALGSMTVLRGIIQADNQARSITNKVKTGSVIGGSSDLTLAGNGAGNPAMANTQYANTATTVNNTGTTTIAGVLSLMDSTSGANNGGACLTLGSSANVIVSGPIQDNNVGNSASASNAPQFTFLGTGANLSILNNNGYGNGTITGTNIISSTAGFGFNTLTLGGAGGAGAHITPFGATSLFTNSQNVAPIFLQAATSGQILDNNITAGGSATGYGFAGANNLTVGGTYTVGGQSTTIANVSTATLTYANTVTVTSNLAIAGSGNTTFSSTSSFSAAAKNFATYGTGTVTLAGANNLTAVTSFNGGTVVLDYSAANANRLSQSATPAANALTLGGVNLQLKGGSYAQALGTGNGTTLGMGYSTITQTESGTSTLALAGITRNVGSAIDFGADNIASTTNAGTGGILGGYATVGGATWAVGGGLITGLASYNPGFAAATNVDAATGTSAPGTMTINSLRFNNSGGAYTVTVGTGNTMTVTTGGILVTGNVGSNAIAINGGTLTSGNGQDIVVTQNNTAAALTIASNLAGGMALTKNGPGTLILTGSNSSSGNGVYINGGTLSVGASANFYPSTLTLNGGTLEATGSFATASRGISLGQNGGTFQVDPTFTLTLTNGVASANAYGGFTKTGTGTLVLAGAGSYQGPTNINAGTVQLGNVLGLGTSAATSNRTMSPVTINTNGTLDIAGFSPSLGNLTLAGGSIIDSAGTAGTVSAYTFTLQGGTVSAKLADMVIGGNTSNSVNVLKTTGGTVTLSGANTYTGRTQIDAGKLIVNGSIGSGTVNVASGAILAGSGSTGGFVNAAGVVAPGAHLPLTISGGLSFASTGELKIDVAGDSGYDSLKITGGDVALSSAVLSLTASQAPTTNAPLWVVDNTGSGLLTGTFSGLANGDTVATIDGATYKVYYGADKASNSMTGGNDVALAVTIPEPASVGLVVGIAAMAVMGRRRRVA